MAKRLVVLTYPPDFDGELHITLNRKPCSESYDMIGVTFNIATRKDESNEQMLLRFALDLKDQMLRRGITCNEKALMEK